LELSGNTYKNKSEWGAAVVKINNDVPMSNKEMSKFYGVGILAINKKLKKLFNSGEMNQKQVSSILTHKTNDGKFYHHLL
jgi:hypothetical protein